MGVINAELKKSTATLSLDFQSLIVGALCNEAYVPLGSLDLSLVFNMVGVSSL
jgi:hypothetical protein